MTDSISAKDRELIESARKVNKVLSLFIMALQEQSSRIPTESQFSVAAMLVALADDIRERASARAVNSANTQQVAKSSGAERLFRSTVAGLQIEA